MSPVAIFLLTIFTLHALITSNPDDRIVQEKNALLKFIRAIRINTTKLNWNVSEHVCTWKGVACADNKTIMYLKLPAKSLVGEIPNNTLGMLSGLRVLSLRINKLNGSIPSDFSNLTKLTRLTLYNNSFTGQLPFMKLDNRLKSFNVSLNKLNSSIPSSLSRFSKAAFSPNVYFCGKPFEEQCNNSYPSPYMEPEKNNTGKKKQEIVGISVGSGLLLLLLLCCVQKKIYEQNKESTKSPSVASGAASMASKSSQSGKNELVFLEDKIHGFDLEDLLKASAEVLGEDSFGISYKQVIKEKKTTVVVKRLKDVGVNEEEFGKKMQVLGRLKNKNVVPLKAYYYSQEEKMLVYDYMSAGSLSAHLHGSKLSGPSQLNLKIALDAARGIEYLHVLGKVVHGNIKSSNILLGQETSNEASVYDYGLNTLYGWSSPLNNGYWAPEVHKDKKVTPESDVYSFGVLLLELLTGEAPKQATLGERSKWVESIVSEKPKVEMSDMEQLWRNIAKDCVSIVPDQRPSMHDVVTMMEDMWLRPSSDDHSKGYDFTPSTDTRDTPSTSTP